MDFYSLNSDYVAAFHFESPSGFGVGTATSFNPQQPTPGSRIICCKAAEKLTRNFLRAAVSRGNCAGDKFGCQLPSPLGTSQSSHSSGLVAAILLIPPFRLPPTGCRWGNEWRPQKERVRISFRNFIKDEEHP
ncbi:hypothetical protein CDAR_397011 [Caerostris darwini]|uniref:Uncharacterized protein n=1 Tax=Caerostris darwini TaxID=1538125 RepID=A0AAV4Q8L0_9ARAC|nr:hypothetical protein CDAR_397011 [Caerostris darwini]